MKLLICAFVSFLSVGLMAQNEIVPITTESKPLVDVFTIVEEMPEFPEGEEGLRKFYVKNSTHPVVQKDRKALVVYYQVIIDEDGNATNFKILRGQSDRLNNLTEEIVSKMPKWKPGKQNGEFVRVVKNLSIRYAALD